MSTITYNAELKFKDNADQEYWTSLLDVSRLAYNECANIITTVDKNLTKSTSSR